MSVAQMQVFGLIIWLVVNLGLTAVACFLGWRGMNSAYGWDDDVELAAMGIGLVALISWMVLVIFLMCGGQ
jgi:hypothetical protein